jgi:PAS domain S-box-containing protein
MEQTPSSPTADKSRILPITAGALAFAIFLVDAVTPLDMAVAVLYVVVVLMAANALDRRGVLLVSAGCLALTVVAYLLAHGLTMTTALGRCVMSVSAIGITTFLALKNQTAAMGLREQARLLDLTHDSIFVRDMNDAITYWNRGAEVLYGWRREEAIGKVCHELMQTSFPRPLAAITEELLDAGRWEGELTHTRRDGTQVVVASRWSLQRDERGRPVEIMETNNDITARREAEQRIRKAERELRLTIDTIPTLAWNARPDGFKEYLNKRWLDYTGLALEDALGWGWQAAVHPDDRATVSDTWRAILATGVPGEVEARLRRFDGEYRWFLFRAAPYRDDCGEIVGWYGTNTDIEDRKRAEERLRRAESELRTTLDTIPAMVISAWPDGTPDFINARWIEEGFSEDDLRSGLSAVVHPDDLADIAKKRSRSLATGEPYQAEVRLRKADGKYRWYLTQAVTLRDETGRVVKRYSTATDIEDRKRAEESLRRAERELRTTIDTIPALVLSAWPDGTMDFINARWAEQGFSEQDLLSDWSALVHPDDLPELTRKRQQSLATGDFYEAEARFRHTDGEYRWFLIRALSLRDETGQPAKRYATATDIEDRKQAEDALRRSEALLAETQELSHTGSVGYDATTGDVFWSAEGARIFGYDPSAKPTLPLLLQRVHPDDIDLATWAFDSAMEGRIDTAYSEWRLLMPDGSLKYVHSIVRSEADLSGKREALGAVIDVSAAKAAEAALHKAQAELAHVTRVTALGELTASIAHEVNQPLAAIVTNGQACLRWLGRDVPDLDEARSAVRRIVADADRASEVIRRIRELARKTDSQQEWLNLDEVIDDVVLLVRREVLSHQVSLQLDLAPDLPPVRADRVQLQQVVINLLINAVQAMAPVTDRPRALLISARTHDADRVLVAVQDSGIGIDPEHERRLFDTFFTTKADGVGMGLSICRSIIEAHGGEVWASSNTGPGTTFQFTLPASPEQAA